MRLALCCALVCVILRVVFLRTWTPLRLFLRVLRVLRGYTVYHHEEHEGHEVWITRGTNQKLYSEYCPQ